MPFSTPHQERLKDDIRGLIRGDVRCDETILQAFSTDASLLQCRPLAVVWPRDTDDLVECVRYAQEKNLPLHGRGAGTGLAGESLGSGMVLDFSRCMVRVLAQTDDSVTVQPGLSCTKLNQYLKKTQNRCFRPSFGSSNATTVGSLLSRDGAGRHWLRDGFPSDSVESLKVVLADGQVLTLSKNAPPLAIETVQSDVIQGLVQSATVLGDKGISLARGIVLGQEHVFADEVYRILNSSYYEIDQTLSHFLPVNRAGYRCHDILIGSDGKNVDLAALMMGSEGTLGLIVEATLKTAPCLVRGTGRSEAAILFFNSLENAAKAVADILPFQPSLCELIDRRRLSMTLEIDGRLHKILPVEAEAVLLIEFDSDLSDVTDRFSMLMGDLQKKSHLTVQAVRVNTAEDGSLFDTLLHITDYVLFRMKRSLQPIPLFPDIAIPVPALESFLPEVFHVLRLHGVTASISGHIGHGHLRIAPLVNLTSDSYVPLLQHLAESVYALVRKYGGTLNSEGALGFLKTAFLPAQFPQLMPVFQSLKQVFDPSRLLNPGKIIPEEESWVKKLRHGLPYRGLHHPPISSGTQDKPSFVTNSVLPPPSKPSLLPSSPIRDDNAETPNVQKNDTTASPSTEWDHQLQLQLKWDPDPIFESAYLCNGCGHCFQRNPQTRSCPLFRCGGAERIPPRTIPNLLRAVIDGDLNLDTLTHEQANQVMNACFHCHLCQIECPAGVDIAQLAFRGKSAYVAARGLPLADLFLTNLDSWLKWLSLLSWPVNGMLRNSFARWLLEKTFQIHHARKLPKLAPVSYLNHLQWLTWPGKFRSTLPSEDSTEVALFIDSYANHFDPKLVDLAARILEHNGLKVFVPPRQWSSGLIPFSLGDRELAKKLAKHNLADLIRQGFHIVTLEPASASCMEQDYPYVADSVDFDLLRTHVTDFCEFLLKRHQAGQMRLDFAPVAKTVGYHAPCRSISRTTRWVASPTAAEELLRLIPELDVRRLECGCCGMAGIFGLQRKNYRRSLRIGRELFRALRDSAIDCGVTDCNSCRMQMEHGSRKAALHPIRLLATAYGFRD